MTIRKNISPLGMLPRLTLATVAAIALSAGTLTAAHAADEKTASDKDSDHKRWSKIHPSRYGDVIRKTDRVTYPDAGNVPQTSCDMNADGLADLVFINKNTRYINVVPYIPYGDDTNEVTRKIADQPKLISIKAPDEAKEFATTAACIPNYRDKKSALAVAGGNDVYIYTATSSGLQLDAKLTAPAPISALAATPANALTQSLAIGAGDNIFVVQHLSAPTNETVDVAKKARRTWKTGGSPASAITPVNDARGSFAIGIAKDNAAYVLRAASRNGTLEERATKISGTSGTNFGASVVEIGDINADQTPDIAVGAPAANNGAGAVAVVFGADNPRKVTADLKANNDTPISAEGVSAGYLLALPNKGKLGSSLAFINGGKEAGALLIGRPVDDEHPGALIISTKALTRNYHQGVGINGMESKYFTTLAAEPTSSGNGGTYVGIVPPRGKDKLTGLFTVDTKGKVDVWTVDMSRQSDPMDEKETDKPPVPAPPRPTAKPGVKPVDEATKKVWLGEFTSGLGSSLARGKCDVTGDGKPDIISGNVVRSEWKYDPYYADTTVTKGWVNNVTGQLQVIPAGTPGKTLPANDIISINGPKKTHDPAVDAAIGISVACLGDTNGDGIDDIAVGSHTMAQVWIIYGGKDLGKTNLDDLKAERGRIIRLPENGSGALQLTRVGDLNGDGLADVGFIVANAAYASGNFKETYGSAFVVRGEKNAKTVDLTALEKDNAAVLMRINTPNGHTMNAFTPVGDINADGVGDFVVSNFQHGTPPALVNGAAWVVYGPAKTAFRSASRPLTAGADGSGYALVTPKDASHRLGAGNSIAPTGDVNGDGVNDFIIGFDGGNVVNQGTGGAALILGKKSPVGAKVEDVLISPLEAAKNSPRARIITGPKKGVGFGYGIDAITLTNGKTKVLVGAWNVDGNGRAYLFDADQFKAGVRSIADLGTAVKIFDSAGPKARFGRSVAFVGNHLGTPTLAVGGDGVIDEENGEQGYAHAAHIMATVIGKETVGDTGPNPGTNPNPSPTPEPKAPKTSKVTAGGTLAKTGGSWSVAALVAASVLVAGLTLKSRRFTWGK